MLIKLPQQKRSTILSLVNKFSSISQCTIRDFASFIGSLGSACQAAKYGWVYVKDLEREKFEALTKSNNCYDTNMQIKSSLKEDFDWWKSNIMLISNPIHQFNFIKEIFSDSSCTGWGAYCNREKIHGFWSIDERKKHINYLEILAAFLGLKCFAVNLKNCDLLLRIDNTTAIAYINLMGRVQSEKLSKLTKKLWQWCETRNITIFASYISSKDNFNADFESRCLEPETEYQISNFAYQKIIKKFGKPQIDLFASRVNTKCKKYVSWKKDPGAIAIDAFTINWSFYFSYAFSPCSIILRILKKVKAERSRGILVFPYWTSQPFFPLCMEMLESEPLIFKPNISLLCSSNREPHPLWRQLTLAAGVLSGKRYC